MTPNRPLATNYPFASFGHSIICVTRLIAVKGRLTGRRLSEEPSFITRYVRA